MTTQEGNAYILGTESEELHRLGLQHQVWSTEANRGWYRGGFSAGQTLLDLGCGPGYCTTELAHIVGIEGKVYGIDKSAYYIDFLSRLNTLYELNITLQCADFENMLLPDNTFNGIYSRWALAWIPNPEEILTKLYKTLLPSGVIVAHEYYDWSTFQTEPFKPSLAKAIAAAYKSLKEQSGDINIGRRLPAMAEQLGFDVLSTRPMTKIATPKEFTWYWPKTFFKIYLPKLVKSGYLNQLDLNNALQELEVLEKEPGASILCPHMREVILKKI
jgi:ubiquinone/menaquinone biosynthesis C-methylase UbiE